jgi:hypothetical protein
MDITILLYDPPEFFPRHYDPPQKSGGIKEMHIPPSSITIPKLFFPDFKTF